MSIGKRLERALHRARKPLAVAVLIAALVLDILAWLHVIAKTEPTVVLHLSTWALIYAGLTALLVVEDG